MCVNHLKRCKTSTFFISRGQERHGKSPANEDTYHRRWYQTWPVWRTCAVVITCCSGFASIQIPLFCNQCVWMARGLVWEPSLDNFISFLFPSLFESGELLAQLKTMMQVHWLWRWFLRNFFSGPFTDPFLSGVTAVLLHVRCIPQQKIAMAVLSKCVTHVGSTRCREPLGEYLSRLDCLGRMFDPPTRSLNLHF